MHYSIILRGFFEDKPKLVYSGPCLSERFVGEGAFGVDKSFVGEGPYTLEHFTVDAFCGGGTLLQKGLLPHTPSP